MKRTKQIDVTRALALAGAFNFLCSCARGCLLPYLTLYLRQLGVSAAMVGAVMGAKHLIALVWGPAGGLLAKHYNKRRAVIHGCLVGSAAAALALLLVPPVGAPPRGAAVCNVSDPAQGSRDNGPPASSILPGIPSTGTRPEGAPSPPGATSQANASITPPAVPMAMSDGSSPQAGRENVSMAVSGGPREAEIGGSAVSHTAVSPATEVRRKRSSPEAEAAASRFDFLGSLKVMDPQHQLFFLTLIVVSLWEFLSAPLEWTADDGLYEYLDFADASDHYSSAGPWGPLGAACGAGGAGLLVSRLGCLAAGRVPPGAAHFYCYAGLAALALPAASWLPLYLNRKRDRANGLLKAAQLVRGSPRALLCAATALLAGAAGSAVDDFLLWQMQDVGGGELHMGLALALALLSRAAFPLLAGHVSRLLGSGRVLAVGAAGLALQCLYFSFLWGPWAALPAQALSCLGDGALWWAVRVQCEDVATPGAERSVKRVYGALCLHLGGGLGSLAGGLVAQRFGLAWLFRGVAAGLAAWCVCLLLLQWKAPRQRRINYSRLLAADASEASDSESEQERDWLDKALEDDRGNNNCGRRVTH